MSDNCEFVFDFDTAVKEHPNEETHLWAFQRDTNGWSCQYEKYNNDEDYCIFHLPFSVKRRYGITTNIISEKVADIIDSKDKYSIFIGGKFPGLILPYRTLRDKKGGPLIFDFATFNNEVILDSCQIYSARFNGAILKGGIDLSVAEFHYPCQFSNAYFGRRVKMDNTKFHRGLQFNCSLFNGALRGAVECEGPAQFIGAIFNGDVSLSESKFRDDVFLWRCSFGSHLGLILLPQFIPIRRTP